VKALAKERAERSAFKKVRAHERMIAIQKIKKERMQAGLVSLKVFADKRVCFHPLHFFLYACVF